MNGALPTNDLKKLLAQAEADGLTLNDLAATYEQYRMAPQEVLNELSIAVAKGYLDGTLTYEFCDGVMNGIIAALVDVGMNREMPEPAFSLYQAFDQGGWIRSNDPPGTDPSEKYAKPLVLQIINDFIG
ncbi:hypothetical protein K0P33_21850 [Pseudomonas sp. ArH3a]|uniref:hypothetical protein n=1 Tax=Pseudomonas sp. ArH3a TaxID=2862945 RepID=UPI001F5A9336|nr:hypothetical protein [Pseudomonas sp. ArH3a]UNM18169.1 hypothetical protein K0P33_21850 [Pseudomonas sp. ArH3a]